MSTRDATADWLKHLATCDGCSATKTTATESPEFTAHADQALGLDA